MHLLIDYEDAIVSICGGNAANYIGSEIGSESSPLPPLGQTIVAEPIRKQRGDLI